MASRSNFLQLIIPLNSEFEDTWDQPINENWQRIDDNAAAVNTELVDARFGKASLKEFLEIAHETDGTLKPTTEVVQARNSFLYGDEDSGSQDLLLGQRLDLGDKEVFSAREGQPSLLDSIAFRNQIQSQVIDGAKDGNGIPTWLGFTGPNVQIDGSSTLLYTMTGGKVMRTRTLQQVDLTGASAGNKAIVATFQSDGIIIVDGDSGTPPPATPTGITGSDGTKDRKFVDSAVDFTTFDVQVGDILEILGTNANAGEYRIKEIAPLGEVNALIIEGVFNGGGLASLNYIIKDVMSPVFSFEDAFTPGAGKIQIGEADFDGGSVTAVRAVHFKDLFTSEWRAVDVSGGSPDFTEVFNHNFLSTNLELVVQVSQVNDGTGEVEILSLATLDNTLGVDVTNGTLAYVQGTFDPGTSDASHAADALNGDVAGSLTGIIEMAKSIKASFNKNTLTLKNPVSARFYTDIDGNVRQAGFIRAILRKRG